MTILAATEKNTETPHEQRSANILETTLRARDGSAKIKRLMDLTDIELAKRGVSRSEIVKAVFEADLKPAIA